MLRLVLVTIIAFIPDVLWCYEVLIYKNESKLVVTSGKNTIKSYKISTGRGGIGHKEQRGDNKTPIGTYRVVGFNEKSKFDYFIRLNYPNAKDAFYGYKSGKISLPTFRAIVKAVRSGKTPPQHTMLGGAIGIHGIGDETPEQLHIHNSLDWTEGCIALRNAEIQELRAFIQIGTRVVIKE